MENKNRYLCPVYNEKYSLVFYILIMTYPFMYISTYMYYQTKDSYNSCNF